MRVTSQNVKLINYICGSKNPIEHDRSKLINLVLDAVSVNMYLDKMNPDRKIYIDYETEHTEYSPERVDPCPDFYGLFTLRYENYPNETIGDPMTIDELDDALFILNDFLLKI